jgi:hypothetical protein
MPSPNRQWNARTLLLIATGLVLLGMVLPYGYLLVYPFRLFNTFIHEVGHAVAAVATGGQVLEMRVNLDTSGHVMSSGGWRVVISSAGYLGSIAAGAALLLAGRKRKWARPTLLFVGTATILSTAAFAGMGATLAAVLGLVAGLAVVGFGVRNLNREQPKRGWSLVGVGGVLGVGSLVILTLTGALLTWVIGLGIGAGLLAVAIMAKPMIQHLTVLFLGVQLSVDGLHSVRDLLFITTHNLGHSDAANMAQHTGIPATFWALLWGAMGLVVVAGAFWIFWRDERTSKTS